MQKLKAIVLGTLLLAATGYAGLKGYLYIKHKHAFEEIIASAAPFAEIQYGSITSTLKGSFGLEDVRITPHQLGEEIRVKSIEFQTPGLKFLLQDANIKERGEFPERLGLVVRGLELDMTGKLMQLLATVPSHSGQFQLMNDGLCGHNWSSDPSQYRQLGYQKLVSDIALGYEFDETSSHILIHMDYATRDIASISLSAEIVGPTAPSVTAVMATPSMYLADLALTFRDESYTDRVNQYCAEVGGLTVDDYIIAAVDQSDKDYAQQWGFIPGPGIREAYREFLVQSSVVEISAHPNAPLDLTTLPLYDPADIPRLLNLDVRINGKPVTDLSLTPPIATRPGPASRVTPESPASVSPSILSKAPTTDAEAHRQPSGKQMLHASTHPSLPRAKPSFHAVDLDDLAYHLGQPIRVHMTAERLRSGKLTAYSNRHISVRQQVHGGKMSYKIPVEQINKVEVYYRR